MGLNLQMICELKRETKRRLGNNGEILWIVPWPGRLKVMSAPIEIEPETAELLAAEARARGLSIDDYLRTLLPTTNGGPNETPLYESATREEWVHAFREWAASHPVLAEAADDSRDRIYERRGE